MISRQLHEAEPIAGAVQPGTPLADAMEATQLQLTADADRLNHEVRSERAAKQAEAERSTLAGRLADKQAELDRMMAERDQALGERAQAEAERGSVADQLRQERVARQRAESELDADAARLATGQQELNAKDPRKQARRPRQ